MVRILLTEGNKELKHRVFPLGDGIRKHLESTLASYNGDKTVDGYKRLNNILSMKNGIAYNEMKRIKNFFDNYNGSDKSDEYILNGGDEMRTWVNNTLGLATKTIDDRKAALKAAGADNAYIKPHEKQRRNVKPTVAKVQTNNTNRPVMDGNAIRFENKERKTEGMNRQEKLTERRIRRIIESAIKEAVAAGEDDILDALHELGWDYVDYREVSNAKTGQTGTRFRIVPGKGACGSDELKSRMYGYFGMDRIMFSVGQYKYAPELGSLSMIIIDE